MNASHDWYSCYWFWSAGRSESHAQTVRASCPQQGWSGALREGDALKQNLELVAWKCTYIAEEI